MSDLFWLSQAQMRRIRILEIAALERERAAGIDCHRQSGDDGGAADPSLAVWQRFDGRIHALLPMRVKTISRACQDFNNEPRVCQSMVKK